MTGYGSPNVRRRRLAAELRRLRERAGFIGEEVAAASSGPPRSSAGSSAARAGSSDRPASGCLSSTESTRRREEAAGAGRGITPASRLRRSARASPTYTPEFLSVEAEAESGVELGAADDPDCCRLGLTHGRCWSAGTPGPPSPRVRLSAVSRPGAGASRSCSGSRLWSYRS